MVNHYLGMRSMSQSENAHTGGVAAREYDFKRWWIDSVTVLTGSANKFSSIANLHDLEI